MPRRQQYGALFKSYSDVALWYARGRDPVKGRRVGGWGLMQRIDGAFVLHICREPVLRITPDNVLTFMVDGESGRRFSNTLSMTLHKAVPLVWERVGMRRYRVGGRLNNGDYPGPELFNGLQYNLATNMWLNAKPDLADRVDNEARKEWLKLLRAFKNGIKVRIKVGVMDGVAAQLSKGHKFDARYPDWDSDEWRDMLYQSICEGKYPTELMAGFVLTAHRYRWRQYEPPSHSVMTNAVETLLKRMDIPLRKKFGVFVDNEVEKDD